MTAPTMLTCGCWEDKPHQDGCQLGAAEEVARFAYDLAHAQGRNGIVAALAGLTAAGLLRDLADDDPEDLLEGILDMLWDTGLIGVAS